MEFKISYVLGLFAAVELCWLAFQYSYTPTTFQFWTNSTEHLAHQQAVNDVVRKFLADIKDLHPKAAGVPPLDQWDKDMAKDMHDFQDEGGLPDGEKITVAALRDYLKVDETSRTTLQKMHREVVHRIPPAPKTLSGRGIVMTGGGKLFGNSLIAIRFVLEYHPHLPIELWMAREEYEPLYCEEVFPALNVSCKIMEDVFGSEVEGFDYMGYPLKSLALLGSAFEEIYFMDIDSFALQSINDLFSSPAYKETGFISWPDYWFRVATPEFYHIADVFDMDKVDPSKSLEELDGTVQERLSSESGQIVIDKVRHWDTLCLSAYYNLNGKDYYYPLLSQNKDVAGFGDKETFISAAAVLKKPAYQVKTSIQTLAYPRPEGGFHGSGMVQADPFADWKLSHGQQNATVPAYVLHANNMKIDPFFTFSDHLETNWNMPNLKKWRRRSLGNANHVKKIAGFDAELVLFQVTQNVICDWLIEWEPNNIGGENIEETCKIAKAHVKWMEEHPIPY